MQAPPRGTTPDLKDEAKAIHARWLLLAQSSVMADASPETVKRAQLAYYEGAVDAFRVLYPELGDLLLLILKSQVTP